MTAETGTSKTGAVHKYYKCLDKKKTCKCDKQSVPKEKIENFVFEKTKQYVLQPNIIEEIAEVVTQKLNANIFSNIVLDKLKEKLNAKNKAIILILDDIEKGILTISTQDRLLKLEDDKAIIEEKIAMEKAHQLKPLEKSQIVNFLKVYAKNKLDSNIDKNDFINNFIMKVLFIMTR